MTAGARFTLADRQEAAAVIRRLLAALDVPGEAAAYLRGVADGLDTTALVNKSQLVYTEVHEHEAPQPPP